MNSNAAESAKPATSARAEREIAHGMRLAQENPEEIWGWNSPAGLARAKRRAAMISRGAHLASGMHVLEVGAGTGLFTVLFAATGAHLTAVDISEELLSVARARRLPERQVVFLQKRFEECDIDGPFDAVVGSSVLHHLDAVVAIDNMYRLLKPGGIISFAEPNMLNPQIAAQKNIRWLKERLGDSPDEAAFIRWRLAKQLKRAGFVNIRIKPHDWLHPWTPPVFIRVVSMVGNVLERIPLVREFAGSLFICASRPARQ